MNFTMKAAAMAALALILTACGGGGGGSSSSNPPSSYIDPVTGSPVSGSPTNSITGVVYAYYVAGATVTAYNVQSDGSNGTLLGTSAVTGTDGRFTMNLNATPTGMVRLVASGGTFSSEADATKQSIDSLELVTPYVTTDLNAFVITPVTHIASRGLGYQARRGATTLANAYSNAWNSALSLSGTNAPLKNDDRGIVNILSTVPNTAADTGHAYQDLITGLEWFGVKYDLPSKVVFRVAAAAGEAGYGTDGVNGDGTPINVGKWVGGSFDESQAMTLDQVMELPKADPSNPTLHDNIKSIMSVNIIRDFYLDAACKDASRQADTVARYPHLAGFFGSPAQSGGCTGAADRIADLQTKATTNNRGTLMK